MVRDEFSLAALTTQPSFLTPCVMGMPTVSVPIGDPQSNRKPRLSTSGEYFGQAVLRGAHTFPEVCGWAEASEGRSHCSSNRVPLFSHFLPPANPPCLDLRSNEVKPIWALVM